MHPAQDTRLAALTSTAHPLTAPWYASFPGLAITIVVVGMNFLADGLQDALDPSRLRAKAK